MTTFEPTGIDRLGCLYNTLTDTYADKSEIGVSVVSGISDASKTKSIEIDANQGVSYEVPSAINAVAFNEVQVEIDTESSKSEVSDSLSARAGVDAGYGSFSASVSAEEDYASTKSVSTWYAMVFDSKCYMEASFSKSDLGGELSLTSDFEADLNNDSIDPEDFFEKYGTHLISGVRIGGQIRYTCSSETDTYSTEESFSVDAKAKYSGVSSSSSFEGEYNTATETYDEDISTHTEVTIYGGSSEGQAAIQDTEGDCTIWFESILNNPEFMEFTSNGLIGVWELCDDKTRAQELEKAFQGYYDYKLKTQNTTLKAGQDGEHYDSDWYSKLNASDDVIKNMTEFAADYDVGFYWQADPEDNATLVVTGFGARVDKNTHLTRILVKTLDLESGEIAYHAKGDGTEDTSEYEAWYEVPENCVMTGIALREKSNNLQNMAVYYQQIEKDSPSTGYLKRELEDPGRVGDALSEYEVASIPAEYDNIEVVTGIFANCTNGTGGFDRLVLQKATLTYNNK